MDSAGDKGETHMPTQNPSYWESNHKEDYQHEEHTFQEGESSILPEGKPKKNSKQMENNSMTMICNPKSQKSSAYPEMKTWYQQLSEGSLELFNMGLDEIPRSIFEYRQPLKIIYLQDNNIREMPQNFFDDLPYLAWCDLRFNEISTLSNFSTPHNSLRVLMLQDNRLSSLPYSLGLFAIKLKTLGLRGNPLLDPPKDILEQGPDAIRAYLVHSWRKETMAESEESMNNEQETLNDPQDDDTNTNNTARHHSIPDTCESESPRNRKRSKKKGRRDKDLFTPRIAGGRNKDAPNFTKALYNSVLKARKSQSQMWGKNSSHRSLFGDMDSKTATNLQYTNDLWRDIPFDGMSQKQLINKSLEEMRKQILRKFAVQRDVMLQRIKDREVLLKWRFETKNLQKAGRRPGQCSISLPPYGVSSTAQHEEPNVVEALQYIHMSPEEFQKQVTTCSMKLQDFIEHPAPISDPNAAYRRLQEVEEIQRKLCCMKLTLKHPLPT